jgi:hypothetical protein
VSLSTICSNWNVAFWPSESDPCLQAADYCTWAVWRKWEGNDPRSYQYLTGKVMTEFSVFAGGRFNTEASLGGSPDRLAVSSRALGLLSPVGEDSLQRLNATTAARHIE